MPVVTAANFPTLFNTTRTKKLTSSSDIINHVQRQFYPFAELIRGNVSDNISQPAGGVSIIEVGKFSRTRRFTKYNPGDQASVQRVDTTGVLAYAWRFYRSDILWTDFEYMANTRGGEEVQVKKFAKIKDADRQDEHLQGMDDLCFAVPNYTTMEAAPSGTGGDAYSIPAWISENSTTFLPPSTVWGTDAIGGRAAGTNPEWRNQQQFFDSTAPFDSTNGILAKFDIMESLLAYTGVSQAPDATENVPGTDLVIYTSLQGEALLRQAARAGNDRWSNPGDGGTSFPKPKFDGIPVYWCPQLTSGDPNAVNLDETGGVYNAQPYPASKPRYFWVNKKNLHPVFMEGDMFAASPAARDPVSFPDTTVVWTKSTLNVVCNSRKRQGIVAPQ